MGYYNQGVAENEYVRFLQNGVVTAANSHINNYSKNIISLQPVGPLSSVDPWVSAPWSPCINAPLSVEPSQNLLFFLYDPNDYFLYFSFL